MSIDLRAVNNAMIQNASEEMKFGDDRGSFEQRLIQFRIDHFQGRSMSKPLGTKEERRDANTHCLIKVCGVYFKNFGCLVTDLTVKKSVELVEAAQNYGVSVDNYRNCAIKQNNLTLGQVSRMYPNCPNIIIHRRDFKRGCKRPVDDFVLNFKELLEREQAGILSPVEEAELAQDPFYKLHILASFISKVKHANKDLASLTEEEYPEFLEGMQEFSKNLYELKAKHDQEVAAEAEQATAKVAIQADKIYQELFEECDAGSSPPKSVKGKKAKRAAKEDAVQQESKDAELSSLSSKKGSELVPQAALKVEKSALQITLVFISHPKFKSPVGMEWRVGMWPVIDLTNPETFALLPPSYQNLPLDQLRYQRDVHNIGDAMCRILSKEELVESHACSQMHRNAKGTLQAGLVFVARMVDSVGGSYVGKIHVAWYVNKKKKKVLYHVGFKPCKEVCFADLKQESETPEVVQGGAFKNVSKTALRAGTDCGIKDVIVITIGRTSDDEVHFYIPPLKKGL